MKKHPIHNIVVSEGGKVFSLSKKHYMKELKSQLTDSGYLRNDYGRIHRLVAETYLHNPKKKLFVNHKDGNKHNNYVGNLEWCTHSENLIHSYRVLKRVASNKGKFGGEHNNARVVTAFGIDVEIKEIFYCLKDAKSKGYDLSSIWKAAKFNTTYKGMIWKSEKKILKQKNEIQTILNK